MITNELLAHMSYTAVVQKNNLREQLENDVEAFLKRGGKIKSLPGFQIKPRPQNTPKEVLGSQYVDPSLVDRLITWCNDSVNRNKPRRSYLAELTGIPAQRIRSTITPAKSSKLTKSEYDKIMKVKDLVEQLEEEYAAMIKRVKAA
ncbi:hypothetical protein ABEF85_05135 [Acinetobacter thermotolerans]|uniref:hypothetical protein n=1 Tax=Acinetobacter thermotolerans TaxID=3151487 RepID=UPI00325C02FB